MSDGAAAMILRRAPAYATVQDSGRRGFMASGVPRSGVMDTLALFTLNAMLGNDNGAAAIEWALTGGEIEFARSAFFATGGATADISLNDERIEHYRIHRAASGDVLTIGSITAGRFLYVSVAGGIDTRPVMGSRSTYAPGGFGGLGGRRLRSGDSLPVATVAGRRHYVTDPLPAALRPSLTRDSIRFIERERLDELTAATWSVSSASDRTGYRLSGSQLTGGASIVSEPVRPGVIQIPPGGEPIVLMADAPTVGGYRIAGVVISADLGALGQHGTGERFGFAHVTVEAAQREWVGCFQILDRAREWSLG